MRAAGRYRIIDTVGAGATSQVYRAEDRLTRDVVALKRLRVGTRHLREATASEAGEMLGLAREFRALAGLRHPNIVPVLDYGFDSERQPFLTMPLIAHARTLIQASETATTADKARLLMQMLSALLYLHRRDILHRDIKPANVLVGSDDVPRLLDFGLAVHASLSLTADKGGLAGTIAYMAPELFYEPVATAQSDLYSLGIMAYEMFAGAYPFPSGTAPMLMYNILHTTPELSQLDATIRPVVERLIAKDVSARYRTAQEAIRDLSVATGIPEPLESRSVQDSFLQASQFVGRRKELATLQAALDGLLAAELGAAPVGSAWLVSGESGVGKSRLLEEVRFHALMRGVRVLQGQALWEGGQTYLLWRQPVRHLALTTAPPPEDVAILKEIVPDIEAIVGVTAPPLPPLEGKDHQRRLVNAIVAMFRRQVVPTLLILEDLHWAVESLEPLRLLLSNLAGLPLAIIGSYRREEAPDLPSRLPSAAVLRLDRLRDDEIAQLSESILGDVGREQALLDLLKRQTDGNAFFIVEVLRALADDAGGFGALGRAALPQRIFAEGVIELVQRRLEHVPSWALPLLQIAAASGLQLDVTVLGAVYRREPEAMQTAQFRFDQWLTVCSDLAVLDLADGNWRFSHDILREVILSRLGDAERAGLHRRVATTLEQVYPGDASRAETLLDHWYRAGDLERELPYLLRVVELQVDNPTGLEIARKLINRTLDRLSEDDPRRSLLLVYLSQTYIRIDYRHGEMLGRHALALAQQHSDTRATAQALYVLAAHVREQMRYAEAEAYYHQSMALFDALGDARGSANNLVSLGIIAHDRQDYDDARTFYDEALSIYTRLQNEGRVAFLEVLIGTLTRDQQRYDEAIPRIQHGLALAQRVGYFGVISQALNNLGVIAGEQGDFEASRRYLRDSLRVNSDIGNQWGIANCHINLGFVALMLEDNDSAQANLLEGIARADAISAVNLVLEGVVGMGWLMERAGDLRRAAEIVGMASPSANVDIKRRIVPLAAALQAQMRPNDYAAAVRAGEALQLADVVAGLLGR